MRLDRGVADHPARVEDHERGDEHGQGEEASVLRESMEVSI